jgi:hypothetical protein
MKETEVYCDHIPVLGGMAVVRHIPYNVPANLKRFYNVIKALPQLLPLIAIPEARKGFAIGAAPEFAQISQKRRVSIWPERATIDSEDVPSASDAQVSACISCLDFDGRGGHRL